MKERLSVATTLGVGGAVHQIPGGDVRLLNLELTAWGTSGWIEIVVQDDSARGGLYEDTLLADFVKPDLGTVELTISPKHWDSSIADSFPTIQTRGSITGKSVREVVYERQLGEPSVLFRYYRVHFVDAARLLWRQHHPYDLMVQRTLQDMIDAHKGASVTLTYDWDLLTTQRPQIFLGLDPAAGASFYDFVCWLTDYYQGTFTFDHRTGAYALTAAKAEDGTVATLAADDVASQLRVFPEIARFSARVVNSDTQSPVQQVVQNPQAAASVFRDLLLETPIQQVVDDRVTLETSRTLNAGSELRVTLARYPGVSILPGDLLDVSTKGHFSSQLIASTEPWRVYRLRVRAEAIEGGAEQDYGADATGFEASIELDLEAKSEKIIRLPTYVAPRYPVYIEGLVVSDTGEDADVTYQFSQDATTSLDEYRVKVPLFAQQIVTTPFQPLHTVGNLYNPLYKNERVLLALELAAASIVRTLEWRPEARAAQDAQGHQLILGKSSTSNTTVVHQYLEDKPMLQLLRTNDKDTATVRIQEGNLFLQVKENT